MTGVWDKHASQWSAVGSPQRPCSADVEIFRHQTELACMALRDSECHNSAEDNYVRAALLGVTPELVQMRWPSNIKLSAFDHCPNMINNLWQPNPSIPCEVVEAAWQSLPVDDGAMQVILGDGCLTPLPTVDAYREVLSELYRVLSADGAVVLRLFAKGEQTETLSSLVSAAENAQIGSFGAFKWRLAMALLPEEGFTVAVANIHSTFEQLFPDRDRLARVSGWPRVTIDTIDSYCDMNSDYTFPSVAQFEEICDGLFEISEVSMAEYEMSGHCPVVVLKKR